MAKKTMASTKCTIGENYYMAYINESICCISYLRFVYKDEGSVYTETDFSK